MLLSVKISIPTNRQIVYPKLFNWLGLAIVILIIISSYWTNHSLNEIIQNSIKLSGKNISAGLASSVTESLISRDYADLEGRIRQALSDDDVISAAVTDTTGKVIINLNRAKVGEPEKLDFSKTKLDAPQSSEAINIDGGGSNTIVFWNPIIVGSHIGWVRVEISKQSSESILNAISVNGFIVLFFSLGFFVLLSIWKVRSHFSHAGAVNQTLIDKNAENSLEIINSNLLMMDSLGMMVAKRDSETGAHNYRVTYIAICIAEAMEIEAAAMQSVIAGSFLHDIGKVAIPDAILLKPGSFSEAEWEIMKTHVFHGEQMVKNIGWLSIAHDIVANHHERYDGTGYPRGISGHDIPISARIFMVADVFDALCSERPYKKAFCYEESIKIIDQDTPSHFDPQIVAVFSTISKGLYEQLSNASESDIKNLVIEKMKLYFYNN